MNIYLSHFKQKIFGNSKQLKKILNILISFLFLSFLHFTKHIGSVHVVCTFCTQHLRFLSFQHSKDIYLIFSVNRPVLFSWTFYHSSSFLFFSSTQCQEKRKMNHARTLAKKNRSNIFRDFKQHEQDSDHVIFSLKRKKNYMIASVR